MPNTRNSKKSGKASTAESNTHKESKKNSCQRKMDSFLNTETKDINASEKVDETITVASSDGSNTLSSSVTEQTMETALPTSTNPIEGLENVEVTDMAALQTVLGQILNAVKPIGKMNSSTVSLDEE